MPSSNNNNKKRQAEYPQAEDERITTAVQLSFDKKMCSLMTCSMIKMKTHNMRVHKISLHRCFSPSVFFVCVCCLFCWPFHCYFVQCKHIIYEFCFHRVAAYFPFCHEFFSFLLSAASLFNAIEKKNAKWKQKCKIPQLKRQNRK